MSIYKTYDFTRILDASKNPEDSKRISIALDDIANIVKEIEIRFHKMEERIERLELQKR